VRSHSLDYRILDWMEISNRGFDLICCLIKDSEKMQKSLISDLNRDSNFKSVPLLIQQNIESSIERLERSKAIDLHFCINKASMQIWYCTDLKCVRKCVCFLFYYYYKFVFGYIHYTGGFVVTIPIRFILYIIYIAPHCLSPSACFHSHPFHLSVASGFPAHGVCTGQQKPLDSQTKGI
jgi:hypothetical protein